MACETIAIYSSEVPVAKQATRNIQPRSLQSGGCQTANANGASPIVTVSDSMPTITVALTWRAKGSDRVLRGGSWLYLGSYC